MRRTLYPGSDSLEAMLEMQEGVPEYTGTYLAMRLTGEPPARVARELNDFTKNRPTLVRSFAYGTGPALGILLDRFAPGWRTQIRVRRDMTALLGDAVRFTPPPKVPQTARERASAHGWDEIDRDEAARDSLRAPAIRGYRERFVTGRTITLTQSKDSLNWGFDPNSLVAFDLNNAVYPFGSFTGPWGSLTVSENGVLVRNDLGAIHVALDALAVSESAREIKGNGWTLTLKPGWELRPDAQKAGSLLVRRN